MYYGGSKHIIAILIIYTHSHNHSQPSLIAAMNPKPPRYSGNPSHIIDVLLQHLNQCGYVTYKPKWRKPGPFFFFKFSRKPEWRQSWRVMKSRMDNTAHSHPILDKFIPKWVISFNFRVILGCWWWLHSFKYWNIPYYSRFYNVIFCSLLKKHGWWNPRLRLRYCFLSGSPSKVSQSGCCNMQ